MVAADIATMDGWVISVNEKGEEDWGCPECGGRLRSCCGNSHIWCYKCGYTLWAGTLFTALNPSEIPRVEETTK